MTKNKLKPTSIRISQNLLEKIDAICDDANCSRNDYINSVLDDSVHNETNESKQSQNIKASNSNRILKEDNGKLYLQSDNSFFGNSSDYKFDKTEVYDKKGNLVGRKIYVKAI